MKILITGAKGFIGSQLDGIPLESNVENPIALKQEIKEKSEGQAYTVIHCAAISDVDECETDSKKAWEVNVLGTKNVADAIDRRLGKLILLSSCHVFSGKAYYSYSERHTASPVNQYGFTKFAAEAIMSTYTFPALVVRLGKVYDEEYIESVMALSDQENVPTFISRNFVHIDDVSETLRRLSFLEDFSSLPSYKELYRVLHVGNPDQNWSYHLFYNQIRNKYGMSELSGRKTKIKGMTPRPFRCTLKVKEMQKFMGDYKFRIL